MVPKMLLLVLLFGENDRMVKETETEIVTTVSGAQRAL